MAKTRDRKRLGGLTRAKIGGHHSKGGKDRRQRGFAMAQPTEQQGAIVATEQRPIRAGVGLEPGAAVIPTPVAANGAPPAGPAAGQPAELSIN